MSDASEKSDAEENIEPGSLDPAEKAELDREFEAVYRAHLRDVYSYAYYRIGNHHDRARRPQTPLDSADPIAARDGTEAIAEGREELRRVMAHLDRLHGDRREALIMRFALGMDNREIARALGRTDGATKVLIHRAIKQLHEEMGDEQGD